MNCIRLSFLLLMMAPKWYRAGVKRLADVAYADSQIEVRDGQEDGLSLDRFSLG